MIPPALFYGLVLLNLLFVTGAWCLARPSRAAAVVLIFVAVLWVLFNGPIEGHVLLSYTYQNGLTESDLLSLAGVIIALRALWIRRRW
ncbi:hypothetical protein [Williamsia muralis]|uniref:Uncharacterized protein n=1 Tax=Williamsia marianensis TaxID=85044 RepID=A0A2G3PHR0_WILMA|nr:hypothetical protein [Williamsia marianensis]PHV65358.1 hypothetical protein CSW57_16370 [Williamsia marianensis]PZT94755.1 MAG: hypothetical protein DI630_25395 [Gordonia sp. (in: high G+C Gram-positive bacteria)]